MDNRAVTRRTLLQIGGAGAMALGLIGCGVRGGSPEAEVSTDVDAAAWPPLPPGQAPAAGVRRFFTADEAGTVAAIVGRLIPGDARDPGAVEAGVPTYIDNKLASFPSFATPTFFQPPFAKPTHGRVPADQRSATEILVDATTAHLYGFQADQTPQETYRDGLRQLDAYTRDRFGKPFAALGEARRDALLEQFDALKGASDHGTPVPPSAKRLNGAFTAPTAALFFGTVLQDTYEGMFADPVYGGNRDMAGWTLIGYPGAQRAWTPGEVATPGTDRPPQSLASMGHMHPGVPADGAVLPLAGTRRTVH